MKVNEIQFTKMYVMDSNIENNYETSTTSSAIIEKELLGLEIYRKKRKILIYINLFLKRIMDICGAIVGLILLIPITIGIAIANFLVGDNGPLFYSHERLGKNGKHFKMYKFRSMCVDADVKLKELLENDEEARKEWEANQKLENDPRITKIGKFIRKTSLDEVPQFLNVIKNDMSLVRT